MARFLRVPYGETDPWISSGLRRETMRRTFCRLSRLGLTAFAPLALALYADNNAYSFQGQYTAPSGSNRSN